MLVDFESCERSWAVAQMAGLEKELFGRGAWSAGTVAQELDAPARTYLFDVVCEGSGPSEDSVAGISTGRAAMRGYAGFWYDGDDAELMTIGVSDACQRLGIASRLLAKLIEAAKGQGARRMLLEVRVDNMPALELYRGFGFTRIGLRRHYYQPEGIDAYTMSLELGPRVVGFAGGGRATRDMQDATDGAMSNEQERKDE